MTKISVITTTYNRKNFLKETLESVEMSILSPLDDVALEHIVYDDASTDGTDLLFKEKKWKYARYLRGEKRNGQSFGQNYAISRCSGDYIFLIDSDDIMLQRTLYYFIKAARDNPAKLWFQSDFINLVI